MPTNSGPSGGALLGPVRLGACVDGPSDAREKMRILTGGSIAIMCPACWRGSTAAGPDGVRDPNPNMNAALKAFAPNGFSGSSVRPIVISFSSFTPASRRVQAVLDDCRPAVARVIATHAVWAIPLLNPGRSRVAVRSPEARQDRAQISPARSEEH